MNTKYEQVLIILKTRGIKTLPEHKAAQAAELSTKCPDMTPVDIANEVTRSSEDRTARAATATRRKASSIFAKLSDALAD